MSMSMFILYLGRNSLCPVLHCHFFASHSFFKLPFFSHTLYIKCNRLATQGLTSLPAAKFWHPVGCRVWFYEAKLIISYNQNCCSGGVKLKRVGWFDDRCHFPFTCSNLQVCMYVPNSLLWEAAIFYISFPFLLQHWHLIYKTLYYSIS